MRLENKLCIITGAAQGIGAAIAQLFSKEGAHVVITDTNKDLGTTLAKKLKCDFFELDVSCESSWKRLAKKYEHIDVLVNNAGITGIDTGRPQDPEKSSYEDWQAVHHVNLDGVFFGCRYAIKAMRQKKRDPLSICLLVLDWWAFPLQLPMHPQKPLYAITRKQLPSIVQSSS